MSDPTRVGVSLKYVDKLADFESLTTGIWVDGDTFVENGETTSQAIDRIYDLVSSKLSEKVKYARQQLGQ